MNKILPILVFIIFFSCCKQQEKEIPEIHIEINRQPVPDTNWFDKHEAIFLESDDDCLLSDVSKITLFTDRLILLDETNQILACFGRDGSYRFKVGRQGRAPGEYLTISDYSIDTIKQEIVLYDGKRSVFLFYNLENGNFRREIPVEILFKEIATIKDGIAAINYYIDNPTHYLSLLKFGSDSITEIKEIPLKHWAVSNHFAQGHQIMHSENLNFSRRYDNTIYSLKNEKISPRFKLDFGNKNLPDGIYRSKMSDPDFFNKITDYVFSVVNIKETPGTIYFSTHFLGFCAFSKTTLQGGHFLKMAIRDWGQLDMDGMIPVEEETNRYVGFSQSVEMIKTGLHIFASSGAKKELKTYPFDRNEIKKFKEKIDALDDNANPVILLFHSKY